MRAALREFASNEHRRLELLAATGMVLAAWVFGQRVSDDYPLIFAGLAALVTAFLMLKNQLVSFVFILFISTVHFFIKVVLFKWHPSAVLFKDGLLVLLCAFWVLERVTRQDRLVKTPLTLPLLVFSGIATLECFNPNTYGFMTILDDYRFWMAPILIYVLATNLIKTRRALELSLKVVFVYSVIEAAYGAIQPLLPQSVLVTLGADPNSYFNFWYGTTRAFSTMGTAPFALYAAMFPAICFFYMSQQSDKFSRWTFAGLAMLFITGVILTLVRLGWLAVSVSLIAYAIATRRTWILAPLVAAGILLATFSTGYTRTKWEGLVNPQDDMSVQNRLTILRMTSDASLFRVAGFGLGTFAQNRWGRGQAFQDKTGYGRSTDNFFLTLVLEMGWAGLLTFLWILYKIYRLGWEQWKGLKSRRYRELSIALLAALLALDFCRNGGPAGYYPPEGWHYWFFVALLVLLPRFDGEVAAEEAAAGVPAAGSTARAA